MLGISFEMQEKTLKLIKALSDMGRRMSGAIILIDKVGHGFCLGANSNDLKSSEEYFRSKDPKNRFEIVEVINYEPAGDIMARIHALNAKKELPGLFKYLEQQKELTLQKKAA